MDQSRGAVHRDLALFNLAIDSKLRGCDLVRLRIEDISTNGSIRDRVMIVQKKTGRPVQFEITTTTAISLDTWICKAGLVAGCLLYTSPSPRD